MSIRNIRITAAQLIGFLVFLQAAMFSSCNLFDFAGKDTGVINAGTGSLSLFVSESPDSNNTGGKSIIVRNLYPAPDMTVTYAAEGSGPDGASFSATWAVGETCTVDSLMTGVWMVTVTSRAADSTPLMEGSTVVTVKAAANASAVVSLTRVAGTGSVSFVLTWPAAADIATGIVSLGGVSHDLSINVAEHGGSYTFDPVIVGTDHSFEVRLFSSSNQLAYGTSGTVHVTNGVETPVAIDITNYMNPPTVPANVGTQLRCFAVDVSWEDASGETGYFIDRRVSGTQMWINVGEATENATGFRDTSVLSMTEYEYRVSAYNDTGETPSNTTIVATPDFSEDIVLHPIALGQQNGYRVLNDGTVMAYGGDRNGQLGFESDNIFPEGVIVPGLSNIVSIKSSTELNSYLLALDAEGRLWRWGYLNEGEDYIPVQQYAVTRQIVDMWLSGNSMFALDADGNIWSWGSNSYGQLGDGTTTGRSQPSIIAGLPEINSMAVGGRHVLALAASGEVYSWGYNSYGQLGLGDKETRLSPVLVPGISGVKAVRSLNEMNTQVSFLIMDDGTVMAAGQNSSACFGLSESSYSEFTAIPGLSDIEDIQYNYDATIALDTNGDLYGSGSNDYGTLLELPEDNETFIQITSAPSSINRILAVANKVYCLDDYGNSYAWGNNSYGGLMTGEAAVVTVPAESVTSSPFTHIIGGDSHVLAIDADGNVWAWGDNGNGQIGNGTTDSSASPVLVIAADPGNPAIQIDAIYDRSAALFDDGSIYVWGHMMNVSGYEPAPVLFSDADLGSDTVEIALGYVHTLARRNDGTVWAWGYNYDGQLGDGTMVNSTTKAVQVLDPVNDGTFLTEVIGIEAGDLFSAALLSDGRVVSFGYDHLGNGTSYQEASVPVYATNIDSADLLFVGVELVFAIQDGVLWKWGQIHGIINSTPIDFDDRYNTGLTGYEKIVFGGEFYPVAGVLLDDGTVRIRGDNDYFYYGDGSGNASDTYWHSPIGLSSIVDIALTLKSCHALASDGTLYHWGLNDYGQAGNGTVTPENNFSPILLPW